MAGSLQQKLEAMALARLTEAINHLDRCESDKKGGAFNISIYNAHQTCELSVKACLALLGIEEFRRHDPFKLFIMKADESFKPRLKSIFSEVTELENRYVPSKYDSVKEGRLIIPSLEFEEKDADESIRVAAECLELCFGFIESKLNERLAKEKKIGLGELKKKKLDIKLPRDKQGLISCLKKNYSNFIKVD